MGLFDIFKSKSKKKAEEEGRIKKNVDLVEALAKEGKTKLGSFRCFECKKVYPINFYAGPVVTNIDGKPTTKTNCRFCLEKFRRRTGATQFWGLPIDNWMRMGESVSHDYELTLKQKKNK